MPYNCVDAKRDIDNFCSGKLGDPKKEVEGFKRAHQHAIGNGFHEHIYCQSCWQIIKDKKKHICQH